jgi:hypothetical protein
MIKIVHWKGRLCPTPYCDICGRPIEEAWTGLYTWKVGEDVVYFVHAGRCERVIEDEFGGEFNRQDMELRSLPVHLAANMGLPPKELKKVIKEVLHQPVL